MAELRKKILDSLGSFVSSLSKKPPATASCGQHLVIIKIPVTMICLSGHVQSAAFFFQGKIFSDLLEAEICRSEARRRYGFQARIVSGADVCRRFCDLHGNRSIAGRFAEERFLRQQFREAGDPAFN